MLIKSAEEFAKLPPGTLFQFVYPNTDSLPILLSTTTDEFVDYPSHLSLFMKGKTLEGRVVMASRLLGEYVALDMETTENVEVTFPESGDQFVALFRVDDIPDQKFLVWNEVETSNLIRLLKRTRPNEKEEWHIDDWLDRYPYFSAVEGKDEQLNYVHFMFTQFRLPSTLKGIHADILKDMKLFVDYEGKTWRVTGASRLGDIWLTQKFEDDMGYQKRIPLNFSKLTNWRRAP